MARTTCPQCGGELAYSEPYLQDQGLQRLPEPMLCLPCIGSENCSSCGEKLGTLGVAGDLRRQSSIFCGSAECVDCIVKNS